MDAGEWFIQQEEMARLDHQPAGNLEQHSLPAGQFLRQGMS